MPDNWVNASGGNFNIAADWSTGAVPGVATTAVLQALSTPYTVIASTNETVDVIRTASTATLSITAGTFIAGNGTGGGANAGSIQVGDGTVFRVNGGTVKNTGVISLNTLTTKTALFLGGNTVLNGGGQVALSNNAGNLIYGVSGATLTNVNNTISGSGEIGLGQLTLVNQAGALIDASGSASLTIFTGANTIVNAGTMEATSGGAGLIQSPVNNTGLLKAFGGNLTINGPVTGNGTAKIKAATLDFANSFTENVTFTGPTGVLELAQSQGYGGAVTGFSLTGGTSFDLNDITFTGPNQATFSGTTTSGVLTVTDGTHAAHITLIGNYTGSTFTTSSDSMGGVIVVDPPADRAASAQRFVAVAAGLAGAAGASVHTFDAHTAPPPNLVSPRFMIA